VTDAERRAALEQSSDEIRGCTRCRLHQGRTTAVPGEGSASTEVVFIGEGPGLNEDRQGRPFVGQAGSLLTELIASIGWRREDVFITNIVKCRPPGNRDPQPDEVAACAPYLQRQLEVLEPALLVTLGRHSMGRFMPGARIGQAHGTVRPSDPSVGPAGAHVFAMYHPAAALHQQSLRQTLFDDMRAVPAALVDARADREERRRAGPTTEVVEAAAAAEAAADGRPTAALVAGGDAQPTAATEAIEAAQPAERPNGEGSVDAMTVDEPGQPEIVAPEPAGGIAPEPAETETDQLSLF
jgi:uracil-DNA glycosylase family 4